MKKILFLTAIITLMLTANIFGQPKRKKKTFRPEVEDEVLVTFRQRPSSSKAARKKKYANQEVSYRKRNIKKIRRKNK